jgi:cobyrinic acid a,c-diamide synthase
MNGFIIAGTHSGCGKTTITLGLLAALKKKGLKVQAFKTGPDFIDSGLHRLVTGRHSRNLDIWMCGNDYVKECFHKYSADADISIIEGVMGMYDGEHSTAKLAGLLNVPVILVVDAYGMAESAGAVVKGFNEFTYSPIHPFTHSPIKGVIFNRVASDNHFKRLKNSVQDVTVLGYLPRDLDYEIPHRHLGLTVAEENPVAEKNIEKLAETVLKHVDINLFRGKNSLINKHGRAALYSVTPDCPGSDRNVIIAVAYDKAFCFYYEDNLDLLKNAGAEIVTFSPIFDSAIPDKADAIYIGGGYPELYAKELSENTSMMKSINAWANSGRPIYSECGGLMYLSKGIYDFNGKFFEMAGVFPFETEMKKGRSHLGYREILLKENCILGKKGDKLKGHEFHYSEIKDSSLSTVQGSRFRIKDNKGKDIQDEGYIFKNTLASYIHIHFGSNSEIAWNFLNHIKEKKWKA